MGTHGGTHLGAPVGRTMVFLGLRPTQGPDTGGGPRSPALRVPPASPRAASSSEAQQRKNKRAALLLAGPSNPIGNSPLPHPTPERGGDAPISFLARSARVNAACETCGGVPLASYAP